MEDDDEMADLVSMSHDDHSMGRTFRTTSVESIVDPHFDAKARPQQGSIVEIR
jgi:hypothetical protein